MAGTAIVAVRRLSRPGPGRREPGILWSNRRVSFARIRLSWLVGGRGHQAGRTLPDGRPVVAPPIVPAGAVVLVDPGVGEHGCAQRDPHPPGPVRSRAAGSRQAGRVGLVGPAGVGSAREAPAWCAGRRRAAAVLAGGTGAPGAGTAVAAGPARYCGCGAAGRCSHWMPASLQSWWDRCHGEGRAALGVAMPGVAMPGVAGEAERLGWNPGPPARPRSAWVAPSARGGGFGVSGEDQDPSGSRRGEGTAPTARQGLASGLGLAGPGGAGSRGSVPAGASPPPSWAAASRGWRLSGLALSGLASSGLAFSGLAPRGWRPAAVAVRAGTIPREAPRRARNCRQRPTRRLLARPRLARPRLAPGRRRPAAGAGPEPSGPAGRTRRAPDFPDHPSGTGLYAAALPPTRNHDDDSHSTGYFLYSPQTPVQAHFWQNALVCRSSHFLVHTGWPAV